MSFQPLLRPPFRLSNPARDGKGAGSVAANDLGCLFFGHDMICKTWALTRVYLPPELK
jgi:hypothetical protein